MKPLCTAETARLSFTSCYYYFCYNLFYSSCNRTFLYSCNHPKRFQFSSVQSLSCVQLFETQWTAAHQASLSITNSRSLLKLMSIKLVMPSNHLILCCPLLLLPSIFPIIRVFASESALWIRWPKDWSFSFNISPSKVESSHVQMR